MPRSLPGDQLPKGMEIPEPGVDKQVQQPMYRISLLELHHVAEILEALDRASLRLGIESLEIADANSAYPVVRVGVRVFGPKEEKA